MVMGLLVVLSLIGVGLISQTVINTKFYEALGTSYKGAPVAQADFTTRAIATNGVGELIVGLGKRTSDGKLATVTVIYGRKGAQEAWRPDLSWPFIDIAWNYNPESYSTWFTATVTETQNQISKSYRVIESSFTPTANNPKQNERYFLFDNHPLNNSYHSPNYITAHPVGNQDGDDENLLKCWKSYDLYVEFKAVSGSSFGVFYNADPVSNSGSVDKQITGYLFLISPKDGTFSVPVVVNNNQEPHPPKIDFTNPKIKNSVNVNPFLNWTNGTSFGTAAPFDDKWHSIEISVRGNTTGKDNITARVDGVEVLSYLGIKHDHKINPNLIGLSVTGEKNNPTSVTFRNISVTNATP
jgi:hypothetical protein